MLGHSVDVVAGHFLASQQRTSHGRFSDTKGQGCACAVRYWEKTGFLYSGLQYLSLDFHQHKVVVTKFQGDKPSVLCFFRGSFHHHDIRQLGPSVGRCALLEVEDGNDHSLRCVGQAPEANMNFGVKRWHWLEWFLMTLEINSCRFWPIVLP